MRRKTKMLAAILFSAIVLSCGADEQPVGDLGVEAAMFAKPDEQGTWTTLEKAVFDRGDDINLVLLHVTGFEPGEDGLHHYEMNIEVTDADSQIIFAQAGLYGENGKALLPAGVLEYPCGTYSTPPDFRPGKYGIKLTIFDKVSGKQASRSRQFTIR